jgi:hypothetical protein
MSVAPEAKSWRDEAKDFDEFKSAIRAELNKKPNDSEWIVNIEVKKRGNPVHDYRIFLTPGG